MIIIPVNIFFISPLLLLLLLLFDICQGSTNLDPQTQVLTNKKLMQRISAYIADPFINLGEFKEAREELFAPDLVDLSGYTVEHVPAIFLRILNSNLSLPSLKDGLKQLESILLQDHAAHKNIYQHFESFLKTTLVPASADAFERVAFTIVWIQNLFQPNLDKISFFHDMNTIRFQSASDYIVIEKLVNKWIAFNPCSAETILTALLRNNLLILTMKTIEKCKMTAEFSPQFKEIIREHSNVLTYLHFDTHLRMHAFNYYEAFKTIGIVSGPLNLFRMLASFKYKDKVQLALGLLSVDNLRTFKLTFEQWLSILKDIASGQYNLNAFELGFTFFQGVILVLSEMVRDSPIKPLVAIPLQTDFFLSLLKAEYSGRFKVFSVLKLAKRFRHFWRIEPVALKLLFKLENINLFHLLLDNKAQIVSQLAVNLIELLPSTVLSTWTHKICPLFHIDHRTQFFKSNDNNFWPADTTVIDEIDSIIDGNKPIIPNVNSPTFWRILPRIAFRSILLDSDANALLKLWAQNCLTTFIVIVPKSNVLTILKRDASITKWLKQRPDDMEFNSQFVKVFLDDQYNLEFEAHTLDQMREVYQILFPFLDPVMHLIQSSIDLNVHWNGVLSTVSNAEQFRELIGLTSHHTLVQAFESIPELKEKYPTLFSLLYDFDFIFQ